MMRRASVVSVVLTVCVCPVAMATTWYVDDSVAASGDGESWETAFQKIQEGIDGASGGDMVTVAEGIYIENISFGGKNITLRSTDPANVDVIAKTIIDANQAGSVVTFSGTEDETCVLSGFTIRNGKAERGGGISGGRFDKRTRAAIRNNTIAGNSASYGRAMSYCDGLIENNLVTGNLAEHYGGGLVFCGGTVRNNTITGNDAWGSETGYGGGIAACGATIENNVIAGNHAKDGGGLCSCRGIIQNNKIQRNSARDGGGLGDCGGTVQGNAITGNEASRTGGGLAWCDATIRSNTISGNRAAGDGGGLYWCSGTIQNNTINGNAAEGSGGGLAFCNGTIQNDLVTANSAQHYGGGLYWCEATVRSNTIAQNSASYGGGMSDSHGSIGNSVFWGNSAPNDPQIRNCSVPTYSCIQDWTQGGEGNISTDPRFVNPPDMNFRLLPSSPCIDAGYADPTLPAIDNAGMHRVMYGGRGLTVDMGAWEYYINTLSRELGGNAVLTWSSLAGKTYSVLTSSDMFTWQTTAETVPSLGNTVTTWTDTTAPFLSPTVRRRYYRTVEK